jgi:hypothetical protein
MSKPAQRSSHASTENDVDSQSGDARPHRGLEEQGEIEDIDQGDIPSGETYQAGGTHVDRAQKAGERKAQEGTAASPPNEAGERGTSPGTPLGKDRGG